MAAVTAAAATAAAITDRHIAGQGTPASAWAACPVLQALPDCSAAGLLPAGQRAVVVAPHPDDEVLGAGGLLRQWAALGRELLVVGVTDGEAGLPEGSATAPVTLAELRCEERRSGLQHLGVPASAIRRLGLPDGGLQGRQHLLAAQLAALLRPGDRVFTTWQLDGHPDHETTARAAAQACAQAGAVLHELPVWTWHWARPGDPRVPWARLRRVPLSAADLAAKQAAIERHASQLQAPAGAQPILPGWALARWLVRWEYVFDAAERRA